MTCNNGDTLVFFITINLLPLALSHICDTSGGVTVVMEDIQHTLVLGTTMKISDDDS